MRCQFPESTARLIGFAACCGAVLSGAFFLPRDARSQESPTGRDGAARDAAVFADWFNPFDPSDDFGPLVVCYVPQRPPSQDFIDQLTEQLERAGRTPETYHLVHPDGPALKNRVRTRDPLAGDAGGSREPITFSWWEYDGGDGGPGERYVPASRWSGSQGAPRAVTWSLVKDGTSIPGAVGEANGPCVLFSSMDAQFAGLGGRATWILQIQQCFDRWAAVSGLSFTRVAQAANGDGNVEDDDGASFSGSAGAAGLRGDIRIAMHPIDGEGGIGAYSYYPANGDIVLDNAEYWAATWDQHRFFRNVLMHELGHSIGLAHVCSSDADFLMELPPTMSQDGPQHDDIRGAQRHYGDIWEPDDTTEAAVDLGLLQPGGTHASICNLPPPQTGTPPVAASACSIDANGEVDHFKFTIDAARLATITVTPVGFSYDDNANGSGGACSGGNRTDSRAQANLTVDLIDRNGVTVLASAAGAPRGLPETISDFALPLAGVYYVRILESDSPSQTQLYTLAVTIGTAGGGCPGDVNFDGLVDLADLARLLSNFGTPSGATREQGDVDADGDVDLHDLTLLLSRFATEC
jgi:serralysin